MGRYLYRTHTLKKIQLRLTFYELKREVREPFFFKVLITEKRPILSVTDS